MPRSIRAWGGAEPGNIGITERTAASARAPCGSSQPHWDRGCAGRERQRLARLARVEFGPDHLRDLLGSTPLSVVAAL